MLYLGPYRFFSSAVEENRDHKGSFIGGFKNDDSYGLPLYTSSLMLLLVEQYRLILLAHNVSDLEIGNFQAAGNFATLSNYGKLKPIMGLVMRYESKLVEKT
jgi:hypothetical protein